jgi:SpoVK/Ycf46/Vps4 family AAA+-type ATPase
MKKQQQKTLINKKGNVAASKLPVLFKTIPPSSLFQSDFQTIDYLLSYFDNLPDPLLSSRSFIFYGHPGVGKTYLVRNIIELMDKEVVYLGCEKIPGDHIVNCSSLKDVLAKIQNAKQQIIFLDDLTYLFDDHGPGIIRSDQKRVFLRILDIIHQRSSKLLLMTTNGFYPLDERMMDRIEVKIYVDFPDTEQKLLFLRNQYASMISSSLRRFIAEQTVGYDFRDISELIKQSYRLGKNRVTKKALIGALKEFHPSGLFGFNLLNDTGKNLMDVIGKKRILDTLVHTTYFYKHRNVRDALGIKRTNLLMFHGPQGTGKTFMAHALAGELGVPLITIDGNMIHERNPFQAVRMIMEMARRYQRCVLFIDEAEKLLGNGRFEEDNPVLGELHQAIDGNDDGDIQSIVVFAVNELSRFGPTLLDRFTLVAFDLPDRGERREFFERKLAHVRAHLRLDVDGDSLAMRTENMSYRQLDRYWNDLISTHVVKGRAVSGVKYGGRTWRRSDVMFG